MKFMVAEINPNYYGVWNFEAADLVTAAKRVEDRLKEYYNKVRIYDRNKDFITFIIDQPFERGAIYYTLWEKIL